MSTRDQALQTGWYANIGANRTRGACVDRDPFATRWRPRDRDGFAAEATRAAFEAAKLRGRRAR